MTFFAPLQLPALLPALGTSVERAVWDLKGDVEGDPQFHLAKDLAAFANHLGGTILVGAFEAGGTIGRFRPLTAAQAATTQDRYSRVARDRCYPSPLVDFERYPYENGFVLAVNVWPSVNLIAVHVRGDVADGYGDPAFTFPIRVGCHTNYIQPEHLAMYMLPQIRRMAILLNRIPVDVDVHVSIQTRHTEGIEERTMKFRGVDEGTNAVHLNVPGGNVVARYPLDQVKTVYEEASGWKIFFAMFR